MDESGMSNRLFPVNSNGHHLPVEPDLSLLQETVAQHFSGNVFQRTVVLEKDADEGFGFTVSGSSPVHVLRVRAASAAANAGVREGDLIIKVDGYPVSQVPHKNVVELIRNSQSYVTLTLLGPGTAADHARMASNGSSAAGFPAATSPVNASAPFNRPLPPTPGQSSPHRGSIAERNITAPQPVNVQLQRFMDSEREKTLRQMLDKERNYSESLKTELRKCTDSQERFDIQIKIANVDKIILNLTDKLRGIAGSSSPVQPQPLLPGRDSNVPPPLPVRNKPLVSHTSAPSLKQDGPGRSLSPPAPAPGLLASTRSVSSLRGADSGVPPPPPPPVPPHRVDPSQLAAADVRQKSPCVDDKRKISETHLLSRGKSEMKIVEEGEMQKFHKRARSSPDAIGIGLELAEDLGSSAKLASSREDAGSCTSSFTAALFIGCHPETLLCPSADPSCTPPSAKPYRSHSDYTGNRRNPGKESESHIKRPRSFVAGMEGGSGGRSATGADGSSQGSGTPPHTPPNSRLFGAKLSKKSSSGCRRASENPPAGFIDGGSIGECAATAPQYADIVPFEDDSGSDQETGPYPLENNYGPFTNLTTLLEHNAHLAVFLNYLCLNEDPSNLFFYTITDFYREGNAKEMKRWFYEIHSTFLVPGAPLQIANVDETMLREIDLSCEHHHLENEAQLKKIFWRARNHAKSHLKVQLDDFRRKIGEGFGNLYGFCDLDDVKDKEKELKFVESTLLRFAKECLAEFDVEGEKPVSERKIAVAFALATLLSKTFALNRSVQIAPLLERCPTFVSKDSKSFKPKHFLQRNKKVNVHGHQFSEQTYSVLTYCTICHQIIWGIGPQGYQCSTCDLNIHKWCVRQVSEECAQLDKKINKDSRISAFIQKRIEGKRKASVQSDKIRNRTTEVDAEGLLEAADKVGPAGAFAGRKSEPPLAANVEDAQKDSTDAHPSHCKAPLDFSEAIRASRRSQASISRSESYRERQNKQQRREKRKHSDPNLPPSKSCDAEHDTPYLSGDNTESSSNSSLSNTRYGSFESPCASLETVPSSSSVLGRSPSDASSTTIQQSYQADSDLDADPNPDWQCRVDPVILAALADREKKRQDVLNELFNTERSHVRKLKVLHTVFRRPMLENNLAPAHLISGLFSNMDEMLDIHGRFSEKMKLKRRAKVVSMGDNSSNSPTGSGPSKDGPGCWSVVGDVGDLLLTMFDGENGERLAEAAAKFCRSQSLALTQLRMREKADPKLKNFLQEAASNPLCRRLQLKDFIPLEMQRLTKYPLLLENLVKYSAPCFPSESEAESTGTGDTNSIVTDWEDEVEKIKRALQGSRSILNQVNQAKKDFENHERMLEIQKRLEKSSFEKSEHPISKQYRNLELTRFRMVHEGRVTWRVSNPPKNLDLHMVLTDQFLMLLQKDGDKFHLKFHSINFVSGKEDTKLQHSPVINTQTLLVRQVATDKKAFFLVNSSEVGPQMYHIIAPSVQEQKTWFRHITEATEAYKKDPRTKAPAEAAGVDDDDDDDDDGAGATATAHAGNAHAKDEGSGDGEAAAPASVSQPLPAEVLPSGTQQQLGGSRSAGRGEGANGLSPKSSFTTDPGQPAGGSSPSPQRRFQRVEILQIAEGTQLIEPSEVVVSHGPASILTAEPILTPIEKLRRKDAEIRNHLEEKRALVAEILHVPSSDFETIADMAAHAHETEAFAVRDPNEILVAAFGQALRFTELVNDMYHVTEEDAIVATSGDVVLSRKDMDEPKAGAGHFSSKNDKKTLRLPLAMATKLEDISATLSSQLSELMSALQENDKQKEQLRRELRNAKDQLHGNSIREDVAEAKLSPRRKRLGNREKRPSGAGLSTEAESRSDCDPRAFPAPAAGTSASRDPSPPMPGSPKTQGSINVEEGDKTGKKGSKMASDEQVEAAPREEEAIGGGGRAEDDTSRGATSPNQPRVECGKKRGASSLRKQKRGLGKAPSSPSALDAEQKDKF